MDLLHGRAGVFHRDEGFLVDVCGFDGVDLLLEHGDLAVGLFEGVLVLLLSFEGVAGNLAQSTLARFNYPLVPLDWGIFPYNAE